MTAAALQTVEPTIQIAAGGNNAYLSGVTATASGYSVTASSTSGNTYTITRNTDGWTADLYPDHHIRRIRRLCHSMVAPTTAKPAD